MMEVKQSVYMKTLPQNNGEAWSEMVNLLEILKELQKYFNLQKMLFGICVNKKP